MKKIFTGVMLFAAGLLAVNAQQTQFTTGDTFEYTNADGVVKQYKIVGENLIENPSFDNGTTGWTGGAGGALGSTENPRSGGVDGGAYIRPTANAGKADNNSIGTAWEIEEGKTYVFSFFLRNHDNVSAENPAGEGYIKVSMSDTPREETSVLQPLPHLDADLAWTQNTWVITADYTYLSLCARWLGGSKYFDAFILAEVEEIAQSTELEDLIAEAEEWMGVYDEPKEQETLQAVVNEAKALLDTEYEASDLNNMVHKLKEALLDYRVVNASDEYPVDVTDRYLKNTKFNNGTTDWNPVEAKVNNGINIRNFAYFEPTVNPICEINGQPAVEASIRQTVYNLPLGYYRFTVEAVMDHTVDKTTDPEAKSGAAIFCNGAELDMVTDQITTGGAANDASYPQTFTIEGIVAADSIVVGFVGYPGTNFTYVAIDNVKLEYAGFDASIYLQDLAMSIENYGDENYDYISGKIFAELEQAVEDAEDAVDLPEEEMNAEYLRIQGVFDGIKAAVAKVMELEQAYLSLSDEMELNTDAPGFEAAHEVYIEVENFLSDLPGNGDAGYDEIVAMLAKVEQAIIDLRMSNMESASKDAPANLTFLLPNPNFEAQGNWVWSLTHNGGGSDIWVGGCRPATNGGENRQGLNIWGNHITSIDVHQELTGLPNGLYGISAELITQTGYASDQHLYVVGANSSVSENLTVEGWDNYEWTTLTTGYVVVIDGKLTIGAASSIGNDASMGWFQATNFQLLYYGAANDEDLKVAYEANLSEAQTLLPSLLKGDAAALQAKIDEAAAQSATSFGEAAALLVEPIATAKAALATYDSYKSGAYQTAIDATANLFEEQAILVLTAAIDFADAITAADTTTSAALASVSDRLSAYVAYAEYVEGVVPMLEDRAYAKANRDAVKAAIELQIADLQAKFQKKENVEDLLAKLKNSVTVMEKTILFGVEAGEDITAMTIVNPTFDTDAAGWIVRQGTGNGPTITGAHYGGDAANRYMDSWNGTAGKLNFAAMQVINDIPNGTYTLKFAGRTDGDNVYAFVLNEAITDSLVNDSTILKQVAASEATQWAMIPNHNNTYGGLWEADSIAYYVDQTMIEPSAILQANDGKGFGWSEIVIEGIEVTNHTMTIGITPDSLVHKQHSFTGTWFSVDDWTLTINTLGDNSNWEIVDAIDNAVAGEVKNVQYYAIDGRQVAVPGKGIHIVKTVYSNGAVEIKKVLVK